MHAFTVDLEEWFCTHNFQEVLSFRDWEKLESRIQLQMDLFFNLLQKHKVKATFFVLGWVAERHPELVRKVVQEGHEVGSHGYRHLLTWQHTPETFRADLQRSTDLIAAITGTAPTSFRAPAFSIVKKTSWATDILKESGYKVDSSVYPVGVHPEYGIADAPLLPYQWPNGITEIPLSCVEYFGKRIPVSGGAYFRFLPYPIYRSFIKKLEAEGRPLNFYIHPWEIDAGIPKINGLSFQRKFRHYTGLQQVPSKLENLLSDFRFGTLSDAFLSPDHAR